MPDLIAPGDLIVEAWINFRRHVRTYAEFVVWFAALAIIRWGIELLARASAPDDRNLRIVITTLLDLPVWFLYGILTIAVIDTVAAHVAVRAIAARQAFYDAFHRIFPVIWVSLIALVGIVFGTLLLIVPGVILSVRWRFAQTFAIVDGLHGRAALSASNKIVSGRWWAVFVRLVAPAVFFSVGAAFATSLVYLFFGALLGDPGMFFGQYTATDTLPKTAELITTVVPQVMAGFVLPLYLGAELALWNELKRSA